MDVSGGLTAALNWGDWVSANRLLALAAFPEGWKVTQLYAGVPLLCVVKLRTRVTSSSYVALRPY